MSWSDGELGGGGGGVGGGRDEVVADRSGTLGEQSSQSRLFYLGEEL